MKNILLVCMILVSSGVLYGMDAPQGDASADKALGGVGLSSFASSSSMCLQENQELTLKEELLCWGGGSGLGFSLASLVLGLMHDEQTFVRVGGVGLPLSCLAMGALIYLDRKSKTN